jgi:SAM-dependent methyltransferase
VGNASTNSGSSDDNADPRARFASLYAAGAPWEIGRPQSAVRRWMEQGRFRGRVLDVGCGSGENAMLVAQAGLSVVAMDFVPEAIRLARQKSSARKIDVDWREFDALQLAQSDDRFDTVLDSGTFHVMPPEIRPTYVAGLHQVLVPDGRLLLLCFSYCEPGSHGPLRIREDELKVAFAEGWRIESIAESRFDHRGGTPMSDFTPGGAFAWELMARRI